MASVDRYCFSLIQIYRVRLFFDCGFSMNPCTWVCVRFKPSYAVFGRRPFAQWMKLSFLYLLVLQRRFVSLPEKVSAMCRRCFVYFKGNYIVNTCQLVDLLGVCLSKRVGDMCMYPISSPCFCFGLCIVPIHLEISVLSMYACRSCHLCTLLCLCTLFNHCYVSFSLGAATGEP